jgi:hypothetical protein
MTYRPCRGTNLENRNAAVRAAKQGVLLGLCGRRPQETEKNMFNGNLIDELIAIVAKVEQKALGQADEADLERWYSAITQDAVKYETNLLGVA